MFNPALFIPGIISMMNQSNKRNKKEDKPKIEVGDYVMRRYNWNEYHENDVERELSSNKSYTVEEVLPNGNLMLRGFIAEVRVEMIKKV